MDLETKIDLLAEWGRSLDPNHEDTTGAIRRACYANPWFTPEFTKTAVNNIRHQFLDKDKLHDWLAPYEDKLVPDSPKKVGLVLAGNLPLVGFHDLLSVLVTGHQAVLKLSSKDEHLYHFLLSQLKKISPELAAQVSIVPRLEGFDAVIATGSDNSSRYFEYYFGKYPNIIRKNRHSVAVLSGKETEEELQQLGEDIFLYFGLGCRNVSKIYVPQDYDLTKLLSALEGYNSLKDHDKYRNNLDYNLTLLLMNNIPHLASEFLILQEDQSLGSRIATVHFEHYKTLEEVALSLQLNKEHIQCVVSGSSELPGFKFGEAQKPALDDYADNVNTLDFLTSL